MSSEILRVIDPRGYFHSFFKEGVFPDGRGVLDVSQLVFKKGGCGGIGSAIVTMGSNTVSCEIQASISLSSDAELVEVEIETGQQFEEKEAEEYTNLLLELFKKGYFVKRDALNCKNSEGNTLPLDFVLHISLKVLSQDGNVLDAIVVAIMAALKDTKLPKLKMNHMMEDESVIDKTKIYIDADSECEPLKISNILVCCSFGIFVKDEAEKEILLLTPSREIAAVCKATCSVIVGKNGSIVMVRERGSLANISFLKKMVGIASERRERLEEALTSK